jgi:hypothetical protein
MPIPRLIFLASVFRLLFVAPPEVTDLIIITLKKEQSRACPAPLSLLQSITNLKKILNEKKQ